KVSPPPRRGRPSVPKTAGSGDPRRAGPDGNRGSARVSRPRRGGDRRSPLRRARGGLRSRRRRGPAAPPGEANRPPFREGEATDLIDLAYGTPLDSCRFFRSASRSFWTDV